MDKHTGMNTVGISKNGGFAELVEVCDSQVYKFPDELDLGNGFLVETLSCVFHGRELLGVINPGTKILILGAGVVGLLWGSLFHHQGQRELTISEPKQARRETAEKLNIFKSISTPEQLGRELDGKNPVFDVVIDCCGVGKGVQSSLEWIKPGGSLIIFACAPPKETISLQLFMVYKKELRLHGVFINPYTYGKCVPLALAMQDRYFNQEKLGILQFSLDQYKEAFVALRNGAITKGVFKF